MSKTAIILGATGLTGRILFEDLLGDDSYSKVKLFSRRSVNSTYPKVEEYLVDLFELSDHGNEFTADVVFCCIGTTKAKTPDNNIYRKIDHGIPVSAARLCSQNGIQTLIVISALGADSNSKVFYNRTKGEMEDEVLQQQIKNTYILQPSLIGGERKEKRTGERFAQTVAGFFSFLIPKKYKMIQPETIVKAMKLLANNGYNKTRIESYKIEELANA